MEETGGRKMVAFGSLARVSRSKMVGAGEGARGSRSSFLV